MDYLLVLAKRFQEQHNEFPESRPGWIYFIHAPHSLAVKIGYTKNQFIKRLGELQTGSAEPLKLLGKIPGNDAFERTLHEAFDNGLQGEWFGVSNSLREFLRAVLAIEIPGENFHPDLWNCHPWNGTPAVREVQSW